MKKFFVILSLFLIAMVANSQTTPDAFLVLLQKALTSVNQMKATIASQTATIGSLNATVFNQNAQIVALTAQIAANGGTCQSVPQPWSDILNQIIADGQTIAGIAHYQTPTELAEWMQITGSDGPVGVFDVNTGKVTTQ